LLAAKLDLTPPLLRGGGTLYFKKKHGSGAYGTDWENRPNSNQNVGQFWDTDLIGSGGKRTDGRPWGPRGKEEEEEMVAPVSDSLPGGGKKIHTLVQF